MTISKTMMDSLSRQQEFLFDKDVHILAYSFTEDNYGNRIESWSDTLTVRGKISIVTAQEQVLANQFQSVDIYNLTVPRGTNLKPTDRVKVDGIDYDIKAVAVEVSFQSAVRAILVKL